MPENTYNFSSGPAMLPRDVMTEVQRDLLDWKGLRRSVMEISHRSRPFMDMMQKAEADFRDLLAIPDNYQVLFVHGSASHQFAMIPMNLSKNGVADYIDTGTWSHKAIKEAEKFTRVNVTQGLKIDEHGINHLQSFSEWSLSEDPDYLFYTPNETIAGLQYHLIPDTQELYGKDVPLVADMSSCILSEPIDVSKFGIIFAGAQKNIGTSGLTMLIIRDDLIRTTDDKVPTLFRYQTYKDYHSLYNTPAVFPVYISGLVFNWIKISGGLDKMSEINHRKASKLYHAIDSNGFYHNPNADSVRSIMNVPFLLEDESKNEHFIQMAESQGLFALEGHRSVGGMRASIYNAMPESGIDKLISFLEEYALKIS